MATTFRTLPPANYLTPSREEMREVAEKVGLKAYAPDLVADLAHVAAGGEIQPPSSYQQKVWDWTRDRLKTGQGFQEKFQKSMKYHRNVGYFLQSLDVQSMPGTTPLEKAMSALKLLSQQSGGGSSSDSQGGEPLPIFMESDTSPEAAAAQIEETLEVLDSLSQDEKDLLDPEGEIFSEDQEPGAQEKPLSALKVAEKMQDGQDERKILEICRTLDEFTKMDLRKTNIEEPDPEGDSIRMRGIKNLTELNRLGSSSWALKAKAPSYFMYKAVTHQLPVKERITVQEKKQCVFILLDVSGSMHGEKHLKATGVVMNRLKAVLSGDAVVYFAAFDTKMSTVHKAENPEEAKDLIKKFREHNFSGGGTNIPAGVKGAHEYMQEKMQEGEMLYKPEVVVLTDEDSSSAGIKASEVPGTRVHGFAMSVENKPLVQFCESTGGVGFEKF